jgi:FkbM family methyltransferase
MSETLFHKATALLQSIHRRLGLKYRLETCVRYVRHFGLRGAIATYRRIWTAGGALCEIVVPGLRHPIAVRSGTADASTLEKIFVWDEYDLDYPPGVHTIIDAGANIGLSAVFFATRFPNARVIAVEPEAANYRLLERNAAPYPQVTPLRAALWSNDMQVSLSNPSDRVDSYRFSASAEGASVQAFSIPSLLTRFGIAAVDVLKIDIEGAETEVFAGSPQWVDRVRMFVVELHGPEARQTFVAATAPLRARRYKHGENEIVIADGSAA